MAHDDLVTLEGLPAVWAEKIVELRERERLLAEREAQLGKAEQVLREVASDLKDALYLVVDHQNVIARLFAPNPHEHPAYTLLHKYQIEPGKRTGFQIYAHGIEIGDPSRYEQGETILDKFTDTTATEISGDLERGGERPALSCGEDE